MKDYNSKFKSIGYEYVTENSTSTHSEYVKCTRGAYKRIGVTFCGEGLSIMFHEMVSDDDGEWREIQINELSPEEYDAIDTLVKGTEFCESAQWDENEQRYLNKKEIEWKHLNSKKSS